MASCLKFKQEKKENILYWNTVVDNELQTGRLCPAKLENLK